MLSFRVASVELTAILIKNNYMDSSNRDAGMDTWMQGKMLKLLIMLPVQPYPDVFFDRLIIWIQL